ncbi:MAG: PhoX family protein [Pseudomarimonas sp.]
MTAADRSPPNHVVDFDNEDSNRSNNRYFSDVLAVNLSRRGVLAGGIGLAAACALGVRPALASGLSDSVVAKDLLVNPHFSKAEIKSILARPGFAAVAVNRSNQITVPAGYSARVMFAWGEPIAADGPVYLDGGLNSGADQEMQIGMHHDGIHYFPLINRPQREQRGVLVMNHEYIDQPQMHRNGATTVNGIRNADEVRKEIAAHGVSVLEIVQRGGVWQRAFTFRDRRITGSTPMEITGPLRGNAKLRTAFSPSGTQARGTLNNCGHGTTPWGTYLTCEENWAGYFVNRDASRPREHTRFGVPSTASRYGWETVEPRFNASSVGASAEADFRNEPNTFGYIVEIAPFNPTSTPKKRTAMGRFAHEGSVFAPPQVGKPVVFYSGDDSQNEYIYKFVTRGVYVPFLGVVDLLETGTLYVARFNDNGTGSWLPLDINDAGFRAAASAANVSFADQADVLLNTRLAADVVGATKMDRPEWGAIDPANGEVYFTLTNNSSRTAAQAAPANPRGPNPFGHIIRWREAGNDHTASTFAWNLFALSGPQDNSRVLPATLNQPLSADGIHASPDGLWFDPAGLLWIQTDMSGSQLSAGPFGNNAMLAANPVTGEVKRFLTGPVGCEVTGITYSGDMRTAFVNIQHPGEDGTLGWPDGGNTRGRSATVVITKNDGGVIGT